MLDHVELDRLGEGAALAHGHDVALSHVLEAGGAVSSELVVALLESSVLGDILEVVTANDDGALHLVGHDDALQDAAADGDVAGEGALLVHVGALDGGLGGLEAQADGLVVAGGLATLAAEHTLGAEEHTVLLLERLLSLYIK